MKDQIKIEIPEELGLTVRTSLERGRRNMKIKKAGKISVLIIALCFVIGVNISPAFARVVNDIPVFGKTLMFFKFDKGIEKAAENGYLQELGETIEYDGFTFTLDAAIADRKRIYVEGTVEDINGVLDDPKIKKIKMFLALYEGNPEQGRTGMGQIFTDDWEMVLEKIGDRKYKISRDLILSDKQTVPENIMVKLDEVSSGYDKYVVDTVHLNNMGLYDNEGVYVKLRSELLDDYRKIDKVDEIKIGNIKYLVEELSISPASTRLVLREIGYSSKLLKDKSTIMDDEKGDIEPEGDMWLEDQNGNRYDLVWSKMKVKNKGDLDAIWKYGYLDLKFESAYYDDVKELRLKGKAYLVDKESRDITFNLKQNKSDFNGNFGKPRLYKEIAEWKNGGGYVLGVEEMAENYDEVTPYFSNKDIRSAYDNLGNEYIAYTGHWEVAEREVDVYGCIIKNFKGYIMTLELRGEKKEGEVEKIVIPAKYSSGEFIRDLDIKIYEK